MTIAWKHWAKRSRRYASRIYRDNFSILNCLPFIVYEIHYNIGGTITQKLAVKHKRSEKSIPLHMDKVVHEKFPAQIRRIFDIIAKEKFGEDKHGNYRFSVVFYAHESYVCKADASCVLFCSVDSGVVKADPRTEEFNLKGYRLPPNWLEGFAKQHVDKLKNK